MFGRSVSARLIGLSLTWIIATLVIGGWVLSQHFRTHVEGSFDGNLNRQIEELLAYTDVVDGQVVLTRRPAASSYRRPLSGWYWELLAGGRVVERSRSLWDQVLTGMDVPRRGQSLRFYKTGPRDALLRVVAEGFSLPGFDGDVVIYFTGPASVIEKSTEEFTETLIFSLVMLGLGLMVAVVLQVVLGLRPLKLVRKKLLDVHSAKAPRMTGPFPREVEPLVDDLNELLDHNAAVIERARTHAGNLAHGLKTPLAVLGNEADGLTGPAGEVIGEQVRIMNDLVTRHLARARATGGLGVPGAKTDIGDIVAGLARTLKRIYGAKNDGEGVQIEVHNIDALAVLGERQDVEEMLGNVMDNACKWAARRVRVSGRVEGPDVVLWIDDDGPGIAADHRADVLKRGNRLDEAMPGSGLGLSIVHELAELYHGSLSLQASTWGGLRVCLRLPHEHPPTKRPPT